MATLAGIFHRLKLMQTILTQPNTRLPIPIGDSAYSAIADADIFSFLPAFKSEVTNSEEVELQALQKICRYGPENNESCEPDVGKLLYRLVRLFKPRTIIEVGVFIGAASCHKALALKHNDVKETDLHLVDLSADNLEKAKENLKSFDLAEQISAHHGDSAKLAMSGELPQAELIFIDGDHSFEGVKRDIEGYWPIVKNEGLLILHDSILFSGVRKNANRMAQTWPGQVHTFATSGGSGISLVRKSDEIDGFLAVGNAGH